MADGIISVRIGEKREKLINSLVRDNLFKNISEFVIEAIDEKLEPEVNRNKRRSRILYDIKNNADLRNELIKVLSDLAE
jgi:Arc/MetJ-type ribon-helix-helix transcriptional regulator